MRGGRRVANHDVVRSLRDAEPAHAVGKPRRCQPDLRVVEALLDFPEDAFVRNDAAVEQQRGEVTLTLPGCDDLLEEVHVYLIRCGAVHGQRP